MKVDIFSREAVWNLIEGTFPEKTAAISFYSPQTGRRSDYAPVDYQGKAERIFHVCAHDVDIDALPRFGLTYESYMPEAGELAEFIRRAVGDGLDIICQCDYGQSRSAACAAAILEYYERSGIEIFADYRYYPNQMVFNKILGALRAAEDEEKAADEKERRR